MNILQVVPYFAPAWGYGGPPRIVLDASRELVRRGHRVQVVTTDALDAEKRVERCTDTIDGVTVTYLPNVSNALAWHQKVFTPKGAGEVLARAAQSADVAHLTDFRTVLHLAAHRALTAARVPYVLQPCGSMPRVGGVKSVLKLAFDLVGGFALVRDAARLLAVSGYEREEFLKLGGRAERVDIVPHAIDAGEFAAPPARGAFRAKLGIGADELVMLFLGRINEHKGIEPLLRAFARTDHVRLVLVGRDDGFLAQMHALITELGLAGRALFAGPVYAADRLQAYVDADLFVMTPSHYEETSVAVLEALACGTPALITHQAPVPGMVEAGAGLAVECTVPAIADGMRALLGDRAELARMRERARAHVMGTFSWPVVVDQLERIYAAAVSSR